jgi:hypothetical protein
LTDVATSIMADDSIGSGHYSAGTVEKNSIHG